MSNTSDTGARRSGQSGEGRLGLIIALVVVAAVIYGLYLVVPARIDNADFQEFVEDKTRSFVVNQMTYDQLMVAIVDEAGKRGLPITEDQIRVSDSETRVAIKIPYTLKRTIIGGKEFSQDFEVDVEVPRI